MPTYTIELSDIEQKAMEYISTDVNFWIQNAVHERARIAVEEMVGHYIEDKMGRGEAINGTKEDIVRSCRLPDAKARNAAVMEKMMEPPSAA